MILRALTAADEDAVHSLLSDERVIRHMLFPRFDRERAKAFVNRFSVPQPDVTPPQAVFGFSEDDRTDLAGLGGLVLDQRQMQGELWYLISPTMWSRGLATELAAALVEFGFRDLHLHRIWASCVPENAASSRVLEKLRFRREGRHRRSLWIRDSWQDSLTFALLREEWQPPARQAIQVPE